MQSNIGSLWKCEAELGDLKAPFKLHGSGTGYLHSKCIEDSRIVRDCNSS